MRNESTSIALAGDYRLERRLRGPGVRLLLLCFALLSLPETARATTISLGTLSFDTSIIDATNHFVVGNFTGAESAPPDFPVLTPLTFVNASLLLSRVSGAETIPLGDLGPGQYQTVDYLLLDLFTQARFTATVFAPVFALDGGDTFVPSTTSITAVLLASGGELLVPGDVVSIHIEGERVVAVADESSTVVLLILSISALTLTRSHRFRHIRA
jgi:hypothetical protein